MSNPGPAVTSSAHPQLVGTNQALRLLAVYQGVNANATGDTVLPIINSTSYSVKNVVFTNASISLSAAAAGLFTAPAALSGLSASTVVSERTVASTAAQTAQNLYVNVATAQGAAATFDVYVYGYDLTQQS